MMESLEQLIEDFILFSKEETMFFYLMVFIMVVTPLSSFFHKKALGKMRLSLGEISRERQDALYYEISKWYEEAMENCDETQIDPSILKVSQAFFSYSISYYFQNVVEYFNALGYEIVIRKVSDNSIEQCSDKKALYEIKDQAELDGVDYS